MSPQGREQDIDAIVKVINKAEKFVHISVMDFIPMSLYTPKPKYKLVFSELPQRMLTSVLNEFPFHVDYQQILASYRQRLAFSSYR